MHKGLSLFTFKPGTSLGLDNAMPHLLISFVDTIGKNLWKLFKTFLNKEKVSTIWKESVVIPIKKKDLLTSPQHYAKGKNYSQRPNTVPIINHSQNSFLPRRSVVTNMLKILDAYATVMFVAETVYDILNMLYL